MNFSNRNLRCNICKRDFYTLYHYDLHRYFEHGITDQTHPKAKAAIQSDQKLQAKIKRIRKEVIEQETKEAIKNGNRR